MHILAYMHTTIDKLKALAEETRLRIVRALSLVEAGLCVCELEVILDKPQYTVSKHLHVLRATGLVEERRDGRRMIYSLLRDDPTNAILFESAACLPDFFDADLTRVRSEFSDGEHKTCDL